MPLHFILNDSSMQAIPFDVFRQNEAAECGLLRNSWCEYKRRLGVEFGEYSLKQYRHTKNYDRYASKVIEMPEN